MLVGPQKHFGYRSQQKVYKDSREKKGLPSQLTRKQQFAHKETKSQLTRKQQFAHKERTVRSRGNNYLLTRKQLLAHLGNNSLLTWKQQILTRKQKVSSQGNRRKVSLLVSSIRGQLQHIFGHILVVSPLKNLTG